MRILPLRALLVVSLLSVAAVAASAQGPVRVPGETGRRGPGVFWGLPDRPGGFTFCRLYFQAVRRDRSGTGWRIEYPDAEYNFLTRLSQLTATRISRWRDGEPGHTVIRATDRELFQCPFVMVASAGTIGFDDLEVARLREYLLKGGFLWADDFWGDASWEHWHRQIRRVLPEYEAVDIPPSHPLMATFYQVSEVPQIPALSRWRPGMSTSELGAESAEPHLRGIFDEDGRLLVLMTHNTDIADGWEREQDLREYFEAFFARAYGVGINVAIWVMTH